MNLTDTPWIPIVKQDGEQEMISLLTLFQKGEQIRDLAVPPPQRIALMRLFICITQAALDGPEDEESWFVSRGRIIENVTAYLKQWHGVFDLYGKKPFLQATHIEPLNNATLDKLDFNLSAGNNPTLYDHGADPSGRSHTASWCAMFLLTFQCFSPGGLIGTTSWGGKVTTRTSEHAPAIEGSSLHTFIRGEDLLTTIWMNLLTKTMVEALPGMTFGRPIWENSKISKGDLDAVSSSTESYLGRLVPLSRAIALHPGKLTFTLANGLAYPKLPAQREVAATVVRRGKGKNERDMYIAVNLSRHPWRELASVLSLKRALVAGGALCLTHLRHIKSDRVDIWTGGMAADKGKILDVAGWNFSLPTELLNETELLIYEKGVDLARRGEFGMKEAVKAWHLALAVDPKSISYEKAQIFYWSELDKRYEVLINCVNESTSLDQKWFSVIRRTMDAAFSHACPHTTPRQILAFAKARQKLRLKKPEK